MPHSRTHSFSLSFSQSSPEFVSKQGKPASAYVQSAVWRDAVKTHIVHKPLQVLKLVLTKKYFRIMRSGEKREEFRKNTPYWRARMRAIGSGGWRDFDVVEFSCGYQRGREQFRAVCLGFEVIDRVSKQYSGGVTVNYRFKRRGYIKIKLGQIL